jgi:hypothetical protein
MYICEEAMYSTYEDFGSPDQRIEVDDMKYAQTTSLSTTLREVLSCSSEKTRVCIFIGPARSFVSVPLIHANAMLTAEAGHAESSCGGAYPLEARRYKFTSRMLSSAAETNSMPQF